VAAEAEAVGAATEVTGEGHRPVVEAVAAEARPPAPRPAPAVRPAPAPLRPLLPNREAAAERSDPAVAADASPATTAADCVPARDRGWLDHPAQLTHHRWAECRATSPSGWRSAPWPVIRTPVRSAGHSFRLGRRRSSRSCSSRGGSSSRPHPVTRRTESVVRRRGLEKSWSGT